MPSKSMKVTVVLKDFGEQFFTGFGDIQGFMAQSDREKFDRCNKLRDAKRVTMKIGTGQFRDAIELNQMLRQSNEITCTLEPRRGYKLATFTITTV